MGKTYTEEYKEETLKLVEEIGRSATARKLGISLGTIDSWRQAARGYKRKREKVVVEGKRGEIAELQEQIKALEKENARIKKENEFLEEAARFFAQHRQK